MDFPRNCIKLHRVVLVALMAVLFQGCSAKPSSVKHEEMPHAQVAAQKGTAAQDSSNTSTETKLPPLGAEFPPLKQGVWLVQMTDGSGNKREPEERNFCGSFFLDRMNLFAHPPREHKGRMPMDPRGEVSVRSRNLGGGKFMVERLDSIVKGGATHDIHTVTVLSNTAFTDDIVVKFERGSQIKASAEGKWQRSCSQ